MGMENDTRLMMLRLQERTRHNAPLRRNHSQRRTPHTSLLTCALLTLFRLV